MPDHCIKFVCDQCGLCCHLIKNIPQLAAFDRGDGVCIHLKGTMCDIYDHRPDICSVEKMFCEFSSRMSYSEYIEMMQRSCLYLKQHFSELASLQNSKNDQENR